jgi:hypothetical protein
MIIEYFVFHTDGSLAFTCLSLNGFEADIEARSLTAVGSETKHDLDYTYTLSGTTIISEYTPVQNPLENA